MKFAMPAKNFPSKKDALAVAFSAVERGADSIMCSTWTGGLKAVGKNLNELKEY